MKHLLLLLSLIAVQARAQIIYTDVIPDALYNVNGDTCHLDLNNDGIPDFYLRYEMASTTCTQTGGCSVSGLHPHSVKIGPLGSNAVEDSVSAPASLLTMESIGQTVAPPLDWGISGQQTLAAQGIHCVVPPLTSPYCTTSPPTGQWTSASLTSPRYLGLRFDFGGSTYYGWARLSVPSGGSSFTLKDYAYNSVPDEFILAGDTGNQITTSVERITHPNMQVSPNPFTSVLSVSIGANTKGAVSCTMRSLTGQVLVSRTIPGGRSSFTLDLAALAPGAYLLEVMMDGERVVRKVMKE